MDAHHLSKRLLNVAKLVPKGARLADIGSDHAYLPAYLALKGQIEFAVAGEVVKGPFQNAQQVVRAQGLNEQIAVRLADGLAAIEASDQIDTITICGMGGTLICDILEKGKDKLVEHPFLILQPNVGEKNVRNWLDTNGYTLVNEMIMEEDGHIYEIIAAKYTATKPVLTDKEAIFGPYLLNERANAFVKKWQKEIAKSETVLAQLTKAKDVPVAKKQALEAKIEQIEGVLNGKS
ncbi:tRNA (adenine(22)-N(1))-methyltransferase [Ligilactobacillus faecis]|uniref:tRNA (adenine(22)-N(1))-methyltransferase n=1 Tax=Ligilactobacillus faecis TaxID=762833 RepID=UPI002468C40C|nr:tRNA (adenine(22)-N(1))-methyltransferase TrmK [Ligilactobacillus faecis]WGN89348.1 tRNA (adenine(22)-N(1))-methyltransferase TrmK [Ligilactobacillus faecis]